MVKTILSLLRLRAATGSSAQKVTDDDEHNRVYRHGTQLITPHMQLHGRETKLGSRARRNVRVGIACLKNVVDYAPRNWAAFWVMGKGYQVLGQQEDARHAFRRAYDIQKEDPDVAREYGNASLDLGDVGEAVGAMRHATSLSPADAGLWANLALALLLAGQLDEAKKAVVRSLKLAPEDQTLRDLKSVVEDFVAGKRSQPKHMNDLAKERISR